MADVRTEIQFHSSMTADKRNTNFAYLRKNVMRSPTKGLYPAVDFMQEAPSGLNTSYELVDIIGQTEDENPKVIVDIGSDFKNFYELGGSSTTNTSSSYDIVATSYAQIGNDSNSGRKVYFVDDDSDSVYTINYQNSNISSNGSFSSDPDVELGKYDGIDNWWVGGSMWRQPDGQNAQLVMSVTGFVNLMGMEFYDDFGVYCDQRGEDLYVFFHDKSNATFFTKRLVLRNKRYLGIGNVDGRLILVVAAPYMENTHEMYGEMRVMAFDGTGFVQINSILAGRESLDVPNTFLKGTHCRCNQDYMLLSVDNNDRASKNPDLYINYVFKIYRDGSIETYGGDFNTPSSNYVSVVWPGMYYDILGVTNLSGSSIKLYTNEEDSDEFSDYTRYTNTTYITNFFCNPFNYHRLDGVSISFEKLFKNTSGTGGVESLEVYCRTSDREGWTLLGEVTATKVIDNVDLRRVSPETAPVHSQRYQITKMPDGSALPEFNEIQFKFVTKHGFSVIGCWFDYSYITRNVVK